MRTNYRKPDKSTVQLIGKYNALLKEKSDANKISNEDARKLVTTEEMREVVRLEAKNADTIYMDARLNSKLNPIQRDFIEEIATLRHIIHTNSEQVFYNTKILHMVEDYIFRIEADAQMREIGIEIPLSELHSISTIRTFDDWQAGKGDFDTYYKLFEKEFEQFNSRIEDYLGRIDSQFGCSYKPKGFKRSLHTAEAMQTKIQKRYERNYKKISEGMNVQQYTNGISHNLDRLLTEHGLGKGNCKLAFKDFSVFGSNGELAAVHLFIETPKNIDKDMFAKLLSQSRVKFNGIEAVFDIVDNVSLAVEELIKNKDYTKELPFGEKSKDVEEVIEEVIEEPVQEDIEKKFDNFPDFER